MEALTGGGRDRVATVTPDASAAGPALTHLHGLERALAELATPLRTAVAAP